MTRSHSPARALEAAGGLADAEGAGYAAILAMALLLRWLCAAHPAMLPFWAPWEFSFVEFLSAWLAIFWYVGGLWRLAAAERPSLPRRILFAAGVLAIYFVLETRFEFLAEHQFFYNRVQHVVMHHLGPVLIALAWPGAALWEGVPAPLRRIVAHRATRGLVRILQQPLLAAILFSGSFFVWLIPSVHFRAMFDSVLFTAMNWTMVVEGLLFWCLVLDPRPSPPARASFAVRAALAFVVMFPQIVIGAIIVFSTRDLYSFYDICGRLYPQLGPRFDQTVGGLIVWIPPAMMSIFAALWSLRGLLKLEQRKSNDGTEQDDEDNTRGAIQAGSWTGC